MTREVMHLFSFTRYGATALSSEKTGRCGRLAILLQLLTARLREELPLTAPIPVQHSKLPI